MKKNMLRVIFVLAIIAIICFYVYDLTVNQTPPVKNLFRTLSVVCICIAGFIRTSKSYRRSPLTFYESQYPDILRDAFTDQPFWRKKLLCAVRLYNEDNYTKAIKYLSDLKDRCRTNSDFYAVYLFAGLSFTDMGLHAQAQGAYQALIRAEIANSRIFSNLGHVQMEAGEHKKALQNYHHALEFDRDNAFAYNNIAQAHFKMHEFDQAIPFAIKALEIKPQMHQASALLAMIYALSGDKDNSEKYFHIAISSGRDPRELKEAIEFYRSAQHAMDNSTSERDEINT